MQTVPLTLCLQPERPSPTQRRSVSPRGSTSRGESRSRHQTAINQPELSDARVYQRGRTGVGIFFSYFSFVSLGRVGQEAGVHVLQIRPAGADRGDAEGVAAVAPAPLVRPVVRVVEGLGVGASAAAAAAGLRQLPTAHQITTTG